MFSCNGVDVGAELFFVGVGVPVAVADFQVTGVHGVPVWFVTHADAYQVWAKDGDGVVGHVCTTLWVIVTQRDPDRHMGLCFVHHFLEAFEVVWCDFDLAFGCFFV